jgi:outer membrane protein
MRYTIHLLLSLAGALLFTQISQAQRIAFVNTKYILDQMPEYASAQKELDRHSKQWQEEIEERHQVIKRMREAYNAEAILLTDEMKRSRVEDIDKRERDARDLQKKRFGPNGDLFKKRQELIQPIQDRVYTAVKEVAGTSYVAIFDLGSNSNNLLFASEKFDKSDSVLRKLGIRPGKGGSDDGGGRDDEPEEMPAERGPDQQRDGGRQQPQDGGRTSPPQMQQGGGGGGQDMKPR